ncbi:diguanylate phosphodiesterase [Pseudofrankia inefficax]|uniref:Diguanylate phosphodiesterase n=1 Tax=Pseudofrankia inefficax (strain DSM 45817 / CECT 9037 / DDB 130130 / EuI1c) TaxID=298654 RepID=E3ITZ3_PSEI1|nr:diguanylate phosphodiesterase [Pseudofrankia inefficax]
MVSVVVGPSLLGTQRDVLEPDAAVVELLGTLRRQLGMDLAWLCRVQGNRTILQAFHGDLASFGVRPGAITEWPVNESPITETGMVPDTHADPTACRRTVVSELGIGAYAMDLVYTDSGEVYGKVGCLAHEPCPHLDARHMQILTLVAGLLTASVQDLHQMWERSVQTWRAVRRVLDSGGPDLVYQPILDLRTSVTAGVEALSRFPAPPADPEQWFSRAASVGLGVELELAAVRKALPALHRGPPTARLAVNVSPTTLTDGLIDLLTSTTTPADLAHLVVEITEHERNFEDPAVLHAVSQLRAHGVGIAVDDIGTGYSGLQRLVNLRPEVIKLDRCLIHDIDTDPVRRATAIALVSIGKEIDSALVAEGIETHAELAAVQDAGIGYGQGHLLARPDAQPAFA